MTLNVALLHTSHSIYKLNPYPLTLISIPPLTPQHMLYKQSTTDDRIPLASNCKRPSEFSNMANVLMPNSRSSNFPTDIWVFALSLLILFLHAPAKTAAHDHHELYVKHCQEFVPVQQTVGHDLGPHFEGTHTLGFLRAFYTGGDSLVLNDSASEWNPPSKSVEFSILKSRKTDKEGVFKIVGRLRIRSQKYEVYVDQGGRYGRIAGILTISADGFWSKSSGRACMVGTGQRYFSNGTKSILSVSVRLSYPRVSTLLSSLINGTVESLDKANSFEPIRISAAYDGVYKYTMVEDAIRVCKSRNPDVVGDDVLRDVAVCSWNGVRWPLELEYNSGCHGVDCSPFNLSDPKLLPRSLIIPTLQCTPQGDAHGFFEFFDDEMGWNEVSSMMLIAEGQWDEKKGQLCMVACRIGAAGKKLSEDEDCGISISVQYPRILTVSSRDVVVGHIQRKLNGSMYFENFTFRGSASTKTRMGGPRDLAELEYKYTKLEKVKQKCSKIFEDRKRLLDKKSDRKFPEGNSFRDLSFGADIRFGAKERRYASIDLFTFENTFVGVWDSYKGIPHTDMDGSGRLNVSYKLQFGLEYRRYGPFPPNASSEAISSILAEGIYDPQTGSLCMIGCRHVGSHDGNMDCEILIQVQYAPTNPELFAKEHTSGKITSLRTESDSLYFKPMKFSSTNNMYEIQAAGTIWRKDLEIIMGIVSLSFTTLFIIAQLLYIKRHPTSLPFVSLLMLTVLTLGQMIPLLLNFEAFFTSRKEMNVFQTSGGWLDVNEVGVRAMTMVSFFFQLRLLQLAWTARRHAAGEKSAWFWERKVLYLCLPLYVFGGLIACVAHWAGTSNSDSMRALHSSTEHSLWKDFRSYAGLILDGFLLPQILGNLFWDVKDTILVPYFYIGMTLVRSVPHVYDAYRAIFYIPDYSSSYSYANPDWDFYSNAWDFVIPCGALFLALVVFLQQRFGGRWIVPQKFRDHLDYQKIPVVDG